MKQILPASSAPALRGDADAWPGTERVALRRSGEGVAAGAPVTGLQTAVSEDFSAVPVHGAAAPPRSDPWEAQADAVARQAMNSPASEGGVRDRVGRLLGVDFSSVRLHRDSPRARALDVHGFAQGADVHLAPGRHRPDLPLGRALIAHELAHVAQQRAVPQRPAPPTRSGHFRAEVSRLRSEHPGDSLWRNGQCLLDATAGLAPPPLGMQQRCMAGCKACSSESETKQEDAGAAQAAPSDPAASLPTPTHSAGPTAAAAGVKIVRLAWTVDDGPTPQTPAMIAAMSPRAATWFVMNNQLGTGPARTAALGELGKRQTAGDEIAIHSMHPTVAHSAWFPISLGGVPKGYSATADAMTDLKKFTGELRASSLKVHFARMPGGELSEVKKYVEDQGGSSATSDAVARSLLAGTTSAPAAPASVAADVSLVMTTLKALNLHLWGGSASGPEVTATTWEAESSGVPSRTNDVVSRVKGVVAQLASGKRKKPASFVILAHDTTKADATQASTNIADMETDAIGKGVRVEYYRMADLYSILRGTPP